MRSSQTHREFASCVQALANLQNHMCMSHDLNLLWFKRLCRAQLRTKHICLKAGLGSPEQRCYHVVHLCQSSAKGKPPAPVLLSKGHMYMSLAKLLGGVLQWLIWKCSSVSCELLPFIYIQAICIAKLLRIALLNCSVLPELMIIGHACIQAHACTVGYAMMYTASAMAHLEPKHSVVKAASATHQPLHCPDDTALGM